MNQEIWKPVIGYEGLYEVSSAGRLRNARTKHVLADSRERRGYIVDSLLKDGVRTTFRRHRLVASTFIPNPENLPEVNHINGKKTDNTIENLEWVTHRQNTKHAWVTGLTPAPPPQKPKRVMQFYNGVLLATYESIAIAAHINHISDADIVNHLKGKRASAGGYIWKCKGGNVDEDSSHG